MEFNKELSDQGFPYCPICGAPLAWSSDFMASELGYLPEDTPTDEDVVINELSCRFCEHDFETTTDEDGNYRLISACKQYQEDEDNPEIEYGDYAKEIFGSSIIE